MKALALLLAPFLAGCITTRTLTYDTQGNIVKSERTREVIKYHQDTLNVRGGDISGIDLYIPVPFTNTELFRLRMGFGTYVNAPKDTDFRACQGIQTDIQGIAVGYDRCVEVNQLED